VPVHHAASIGGGGARACDDKYTVVTLRPWRYAPHSVVMEACPPHRDGVASRPLVRPGR
jgi:hypothetical protein